MFGWNKGRPEDCLSLLENILDGLRRNLRFEMLYCKSRKLVDDIVSMLRL
ncbi:hypothetical protein Hanom_Chr15g01388331 [Helianthus anomalus]